jgi:hypothetical protein
MASRFGKLLGAFVQLDPEPGEQTTSETTIRAAPIQDQDAAVAEPPAPALEPVPALPAAACVVAEQKPFDELYRGANVPASPFAAEKLLKLLDGLATMPMDVRKQMVKAMDEADDSWTIDDVVLDAQRKIKVLGGAKQAIAQQLAASARNAEEEAAAITHRQQDSAAQIRKQIADLNALLDRESTRATQSLAEISAKLKTNQEAGTREVARLDAEISRLGQIPVNFADNKTA